MHPIRAAIYPSPDDTLPMVAVVFAGGKVIAARAVQNLAEGETWIEKMASEAPDIYERLARQGRLDSYPT